MLARFVLVGAKMEINTGQNGLSIEAILPEMLTFPQRYMYSIASLQDDCSTTRKGLSTSHCQNAAVGNSIASAPQTCIYTPSNHSCHLEDLFTRPNGPTLTLMICFAVLANRRCHSFSAGILAHMDPCSIVALPTQYGRWRSFLRLSVVNGAVVIVICHDISVKSSETCEYKHH